MKYDHEGYLESSQYCLTQANPTASKSAVISGKLLDIPCSALELLWLIRLLGELVSHQCSSLSFGVTDWPQHPAEYSSVMKHYLCNRNEPGTKWSNWQTIKEQVTGTSQLPESSLRDWRTIHMAHSDNHLLCPQNLSWSYLELHMGL